MREGVWKHKTSVIHWFIQLSEDTCAWSWRHQSSLAQCFFFDRHQHYLHYCTIFRKQRPMSCECQTQNYKLTLMVYLYTIDRYIDYGRLYISAVADSGFSCKCCLDVLNENYWWLYLACRRLCHVHMMCFYTHWTLHSCYDCTQGWRSELCFIMVVHNQKPINSQGSKYHAHNLNNRKARNPKPIEEPENTRQGLVLQQWMMDDQGLNGHWVIRLTRHSWMSAEQDYGMCRWEYNT